MKTSFAAATLSVVLIASSQMGPAVAAQGDPHDWTRLEGSPAWDPCTPITWTAPADGSALERAMVRGIRKLSKYTDYTFVRVDSGGQVDVAIVPADDPNLVSQGAIAYASLGWRTGSDGRNWLYQGGVRISDGVALRRLPMLVMHELGHVMGLGHAGSVEQVMYQAVGRYRYGAGDRAGLAASAPPTCASSTDAPPQGQRVLLAD